MCEDFNLITTDNIKEAMKGYKHGQEKITTKNYFKYKNCVYPVMNIIKNAISLNTQIDDLILHQSLNGCKCILKKRLPNQIIFLGEIKET